MVRTRFTVTDARPIAASPITRPFGTLELQAVNGKIEKWTLGGRQLYLDDICNVP